MVEGNDFASSTVVTLLLMLLAAAVLSDLRSHRIPNLLLFPALGMSVLVQTLGWGIEGLIGAGSGLAVGIAMLLPFYVIGGMGAGDVKLLGVVGSFLGPWGAFVTGLATLMSGAVLGIGVIVWQRLWPLLEPYLEQMTRHPASMLHAAPSPKVAKASPVTKVAYSPAIAVGTAIALWYLDVIPMQRLG